MQGMAGLVALTLVVGGGNLLATRSEVQTVKVSQRHDAEERQQAAAAVERKLCTTLGRLASRNPPAGDAGSNPSRAYLQWQHDTLAQLGPDVGCRQGES